MGLFQGFFRSPNEKTDGSMGLVSAPSRDVIIDSLSVVDIFMHLGVEKTGAFLNENGGIQVVAYFPRWSLCVTRQPTNSFDILSETCVEELFYCSCENFKTMKATIKEQVEKWEASLNSSDCSTLTTLIQQREDSEAAQCLDHQKTKASQASALSVQSSTVTRYAVISGRKKSAGESLPYFESSGSPIFQLGPT